MNLGQIITLSRTQLTTLGFEEVTIDSILAQYVNDGYRRFVSETGNIDDVIQVDVNSGESEIEFPQYVLKIKRIELEGKKLDIVNRPEFDRLKVSPDAAPKVFVLGDSRYKGKVYGTPKASGEADLWVQRGVIKELVRESDSPVDMEPDYHMALVDFTVSALLRTQPGDLNRVSLIRDRAAEFAHAVALCKSRRECQRSKPARVVAYGGL